MAHSRYILKENKTYFTCFHYIQVSNICKSVPLVSLVLVSPSTVTCGAKAGDEACSQCHTDSYQNYRCVLLLLVMLWHVGSPGWV